MTKNPPSTRTKTAISRGGRLAEIYRKRTPEEKAKAARVVAVIKKYGPSAAMMATSPAGFVRGGVGLAAKAGVGALVKGAVKRAINPAGLAHRSMVVAAKEGVKAIEGRPKRKPRIK